MLSRFAAALSFLFGVAGFGALLFSVSIRTFSLAALAIVATALAFTAFPGVRLVLNRASLFMEVAEELEALEETKRREAFQLANLIKDPPKLVEKHWGAGGLRLIGVANDVNIKPGARFELLTEHGGEWLGTLEVVRRDNAKVVLRSLAPTPSSGQKYWKRLTRAAASGAFEPPAGVVLGPYRQAADIVSPALESARALTRRAKRRS